MPQSPKNPAPTPPGATEYFRISSDSSDGDMQVEPQPVPKAPAPALDYDAHDRPPARFPPTDDPAYDAAQRRLVQKRQRHRDDRQSDPMYHNRGRTTRRFDERVVAIPRNQVNQINALSLEPVAQPPIAEFTPIVTHDVRRPPLRDESPSPLRPQRSRSPIQKGRANAPPWRSSMPGLSEEPPVPTRRNPQVTHAENLLQGTVNLGSHANNFMATIRRDVISRSSRQVNIYLQDYFNKRPPNIPAPQSHISTYLSLIHI